MRRSRWSFLLVLLAIPSPSAAQAAADFSSFRLRPGDALRLAVKDDTTLTGEFPVLENGRVLLPLVGLVPVTGVAFRDVERRVRELYAAELVDPVLVVTPLVRVAVLGEVRLPGLYVVDGTFALGEVLARAGGLGPSASLRRVMLVREGTSRRLPVRDGALALDGGIRPGDEIVVGRRSWASENMPVLIGAGTSVLVAAITTLLVR